MLTRVFQSGNSIAVRIPKELAIVAAAQNVEIEQVGDTLVIRPVKRRKLTGVGKLLGSFSKEFMAAGRELHRQTERDWNPAPTPQEWTAAEPVPKPAVRRPRKR